MFVLVVEETCFCIELLGFSRFTSSGNLVLRIWSFLVSNGWFSIYPRYRGNILRLNKLGYSIRVVEVLSL